MSKKILIVEDNELMVEVMTYILNNNGYEVFALNSGQEVFNNIKSNHPDLVILDAVLPGMNGKEICQLIKLNKATQNLRVIMCSGDESIGESLRQTGAPDDVLQKTIRHQLPYRKSRIPASCVVIIALFLQLTTGIRQPATRPDYFTSNLLNAVLSPLKTSKSTT